MHRDTRRLTIAGEHLRAAYDEINRAQGNAQRSIAESAARRALDHLNLALRRLEQEPRLPRRSEASDLLRQGHDCVHSAWQQLHRVLNAWPAAAAEVLELPRARVVEAIELLERATETAVAAGIMES